MKVTFPTDCSLQERTSRAETTGGTYRYFPEKIQPAIDRYQGEVARLFGVLDCHLAKNEYLAGDYSIADIATWPWIASHAWAGVALDTFPQLQRWLEQIRQRPAVQRGIARPTSSMKVDKVDSQENKQAAEVFVSNARQMLETGNANSGKGE